MPTFPAADGTELYFEDAGDGPPVLALAGLTRNARDFDHVAPHLPCRLIRMDYRGRGRSGFSGAETYTIQQEAQDALALLDHLGLDKAAILGTSRGGLIAMVLAATAKDRLTGVALNDVGPEIAPEGLKAIEGYIGRNPAQATFEAAVAARQKSWTGFRDVPEERWLAEVRAQYEETPEGLSIRYDPALRDAFLTAGAQPMPDLWPLFEALSGLPLCVIRGANSDLLTQETATDMRRRIPDLIYAEVPDRGHVPFLDEPPAVEALTRWINALSR